MLLLLVTFASRWRNIIKIVWRFYERMTNFDGKLKVLNDELHVTFTECTQKKNNKIKLARI